MVLFTKHLACYIMFSRNTYVDVRLKYYHCLQLWVDSYFQCKPCGQLVVRLTRLGAKTWLTKQPIRQRVTSQYSRNWFLRLPNWRFPFIYAIIMLKCFCFYHCVRHISFFNIISQNEPDLASALNQTLCPKDLISMLLSTLSSSCKTPMLSRIVF